MSSILNRQDFLSLFPNAVLCAYRYKANKGANKNMINNVSMETAIRLNSLKDKYDIFFTPNGDYKKVFGDKEHYKGKSKKAVIDVDGNIYALIADIDNKTKTREKIDLAPTLVNETKNGYHLMFMLKNPVSYKENSARFDKIQDKLLNILDADLVAKGVERTLRMPGFKYYSDNLGEFEIENILFDKEAVHSFDEREKIIEELYSVICADKIELEKLKKKYKKHKGFGRVADTFFEKVADVDVREVLANLYPHFTVRDSGAVYEGDRETSGYKRYRSGNYMNNFSTDSNEDRPKGGPWSVAKTQLRSFDTISEYFSRYFNIDISDVRRELGSVKDINFQDISIGDRFVIEEQVEKPKEEGPLKKEKLQIKNVGTKLVGITIDYTKKEIRGYNADASDIRFIKALIEPIGKVQIEGEYKYIIKLSKIDGRETTTVAPICGTNTELRKFLQKFGLMIPDGGTFFEYLFHYIYNIEDEYIYTNKMGLQMLGGKKVFVDEPGTYVKYEEGVFVDIDSAPEEKIESGSKTDIKKYVEQLLEGYDGQVAYTLFLSMLMGANSYFFRNYSNEKRLPQVFVHGLSQTGKTTLLEHVFRSFGIKDGISALSKPFIYEKNAKHYMPIHLSEYRNSGIADPQRIEGIMRNMFDGVPIDKGRADQSVVRYESNAQYIFDGQATFTDDATLTRLVLLMANEKYKGDEKELIKLPNIVSTANSLFNDMDDFKRFMVIVEGKTDWIRKNVKLARSAPRVIKSYALLLAMSNWIDCTEHDQFIINALVEQDGLLAQDDIQETYLRAFNLQVLNMFDFYLYKNGMVINIVEDGAKIRTNIEDLRGFIQIINVNFLGTNTLPPMSIYIDFNYIYKHDGLHGAFLRMLGQIGVRTFEPQTDEEKTTLMSLKTFVSERYPNHYLVGDLGMEVSLYNNKQNKGEITF